MTQICEEYAAALFALAAEEGVKGEIADSVKTLRALIAENPQYIDLLATPSIPLTERCAVIEEAFGGSLHEYAVSFVKLLCERGHIRELSDCLDEFLKLYEASDGVATAEVISAVPLSDGQKKALCEKLEGRLLRRVELRCTVDDSLLGGLIVSVDGKVMDGSIKRRLADVGEVIGG